MKRLLIYLIMLCAGCHAMGSSVPPERKAVRGKRIMIIDSYRQEVYWSTALSRMIRDSIQALHPDATVFQGCINADVALTVAGSALPMRSAFWNLTEDTGEAPSATSLAVSSLFANNVPPDVLVFIGDEGFLLYVKFASMLQHWTPIPVVLCAVNSTVASQEWDPQVPDTFEEMVAIEHFRYRREAHSGAISTNVNYTGVKLEIPIRENIEMIQRMMPGLKELVFVDDAYYSSQYAYKQVEREMKDIMPSTALSSIWHDRKNMDSIYDVMTTPVEGRAFLTLGLNIDGSYSKRSDESIDSLFSRGKSLPPLFTLTERGFHCNYWIGGAYASRDEMVGKTVRLIDRTLKGDSARLIPFETVGRIGTILNRTAVERTGLLNLSEKVEGVTYVNYPPSFYEKHEWQVLLSLTVLTFFIGVCINLLFKRSYNLRIRKNFERYKRLYDNLQTIYSNSSVDIAFYAKDGERLLAIVDGVENSYSRNGNELFPENMFQTPYLTLEQKTILQKTGKISREILVDNDGKMVSKGFEERSYHAFVNRLYDSSYEDLGYNVVVVNLSQLYQDRKEKEKFENLLRFASDSAKVGLAFYTINEGKGLATDSWHEILNEPVVDAGLPTYINVLVEDRVHLLNYKQKLLAGEEVPDFSADIRVIDADGVTHFVRQNCYFIPERKLIIELSMDIDHLKQIENQLSEANLKADQSNIETTKFLSDISHEIRTRLNSIVGSSAALSLQGKENGVSYVPIVQRNSRLLESLINNVLDLSELDSGLIILKKERIDTYMISEEMENYIRANLYGRPLRVIITIPESEKFAYADPVYFRKLAMNLLYNAVKFTETGTISFGQRTVGDYQLFEITDTGCGIREKDLERIFKRFEKVNAYMPGTGLGLALCKSIVEHMGGEIGVRSEWGKGSTFWFTLPRA